MTAPRGASGERSVPAWRADLALAAICLIWGSTFILVKQAIADIPVLFFLWLRFVIAAAVLWIFAAARKDRPPVRGSLRGGLLAGTFLFTGYVFQTFGLSYTTAAKAGFITGLYIPLVPVFGALIYRKAPRMSEALGVAAAFAGMALMTVAPGALRISRGDLLVACCAVAYAFHILVLAKYSKTADVAWLAALQITVAAALGALTFWWAGPVEVRWTAPVWIALGVTSLFATALAFAAQTWAQKHTTATRTALILSLEPVFAWLTSYLFAGEVLTARATAGAVLILAGILIVELKPFR